MTGEFIIKIGEELITYTDYDDIPNTFDHVISLIQIGLNHHILKKIMIIWKSLMINYKC